MVSILETSREQARALGIAPLGEIDKPGMILILQKADNLNLLSFKAGMEQEWLDTARLWASKHHYTLRFQDLLIGLMHLATEPRTDRFLKPIELFTAIDASYTQNYLQALGTRQEPELPPELETNTTTSREFLYRKAWRQAARLSGDYQTATRHARLAINLPAEPPAIEAGTHSLKELTQKGILK